MRKKILVVTANYYSDISSNLLNNSIKYLKEEANLDLTNQGVFIAEVPGVFELPVIIANKIKEYHGFIALGCVIKGQTPHFDFISKATTDAIMKLSIEHKKPIGNGILTCLNKKQAIARSKTKGQEAAKAVLQVLDVLFRW